MGSTDGKKILNRLTDLALSREDPAKTNQHQPAECNARGYVSSSVERLADPVRVLVLVEEVAVDAFA